MYFNGVGDACLYVLYYHLCHATMHVRTFAAIHNSLLFSKIIHKRIDFQKV